jgi:hypothetical protein
MLEERSLNSRKVLSRHVRIGKAMCLRILQEKIGLKKFHLRWIPHALSINQKRVIFEGPSDGIERTEGARLSTDYRRG